MQNTLKERILKLKKEKNAIILAHNYQIPEVQDIADAVGDSYSLSRHAADTDSDVIVFCGVHFMAESAKILSPDKTVLLPVKDAGCPMADMVTASGLCELKAKYPDAAVVCYVNSSAEVKAESDICCTSSNALKVVRSINKKQVIFVPDENLGSYVASKEKDKEIIPWKGFCITHKSVKTDDVHRMRKLHPDAKILVHPECEPEIQELADFLGSTSEIIEYAGRIPEKEIIIGTEEGVLHTLRKQNPDKSFYLLSAGLKCKNMKKTRLADVYEALSNIKNEIHVKDTVGKKALKSLEKMLEIK